MAAAAQSPEARELALVEKVEFRIALTDTDEKLQTVLNTYLPPLLLKLTSDHVSVRNKVIAVCQHVNKRVAPENIQLPVAALLKQFKDQQSQLVRHFDLLYAQQGLPRLSASERAELLPVLASGISSLSSASASHAASIFNFFLRCLSERPLPPRGSPEDERLRADLGLEKPDADFLSAWIGKLLLFRQSSAQTASVLSPDELDFLTLQRKPEVWDSSIKTGLNLTHVKVTCLKLISSGAFNDGERLLPGLFASADSNSRLSDTGEGLVKQAIARVSVDDDTLVGRLYEAYRKSGSMLSLRIKILNLLSRTKLSTGYTEDIIRLVDQGLVENTDRNDREVTKLRAAIIHYLGFAARNADKAAIVTIARNVIEKLKDFLDQYHVDTHSTEMRNLRGQCFEVVGLLAGIDVQLLVEPELSLLRWLFRSLAEETDKEVVFSIDDAISSALKPFEQTDDSGMQEPLRTLLVDVLSLESKNQRNTRFACLRFANRCLPFSDATARWIDIATLGASSSESHEITEEARKGLDPYWHKLLARGTTAHASQDQNNDGIKAPDFVNITTFLFKDQNLELNNTDKLHVAVSFCRRCLFWACLNPGGSSISTEADWERKMDLAVSSDEDSRKTIRIALATASQDDRIADALLMLFRGAIQGLSSDAKARPEFASVLLDLASLSPDSVIERLVDSSSALLPAIMSNDSETRRLAAQTFGILDSHPAAQAVTSKSARKALLDAVAARSSAVGAQLNKTDGALLALAHVASREQLRGLDASSSTQAILPSVFDMIDNSTDTMIQSAAYQALSQLCMFSALSKPSFSNGREISEVIKSTSKAAKKGNEKAMAALGHLAMLFDEEEDSSTLESLLDEMIALHDVRQAETQFVVGEALCCQAFGWDSTALLANIDIDNRTPKAFPRQETASRTIDRILQDCKTTKPSLKKASVIWLLCFLQFGASRIEIQERLPHFQAAFKRCLSDRDELVQESASRGLGLVYEKGNRELKDSLVRDLVASFTTNKAETSGTITEDTQLFEPGQLPTGDGSITTYKDIMSLASEVGDSSLVYRFMSLASNNAIWSSRAAFGRFGLSNVLSDSSVDGYLSNNPKLYPKLYRYRFDPNTNVRRSMNDIWNALVKDPTSILETHFGYIIDDLLESIVGREWRARQASCAAIADLIQSRPLTKLQPYIDRIWTLCFKVLDDIKESVRAAAADLARVLTNILLRNLEGSEGKEAAIQKLLKSVLSFLLSTSGLESSAKEVQAFSLHTLLEVIKKGRPQNLRPFVPDLVAQLLGLLSTYEHEAVNYVALNASNYNMQQSDIDEMRLKSIRSSPLMEAIERCLDVLDAPTMESLVPKLQETLKAAVGVPSKVGFSRVLVTLSTRSNFVFRPHADGQLAAVQRRIMDRNETVSSSYAASMGYVARLASNEQLLKTVQFAKQLYFGDESGERARFVAGEILQAMARHATDRYSDLATDIFPFVFFGRFDDDKRTREVFKETYDETVSGPRAVALYLQDIMKLAQAHLDSKVWTFKHAGALAISEVVTSVAASHGSISEGQGEQIWPGLRTALAEKSWDGKEQVLKGLVTFAEKGEQFLRPREEHRREIVKIAIREAKRRNRTYQADALDCLGKVAAALPASDVDFASITGIARPLVEDIAQKQKSGDDDKDSESEELRRSITSGAVAAVFGTLKAHMISENSTLGDEVLSYATLALDIARTALRIAYANPSTVQSGVFAHLKELCRSLQQRASAISWWSRTGKESLLTFLADILTTDLAAMQEKPRTLRAESVDALTVAITATATTAPSGLSEKLTGLLADERSLAIRGILHQAQRRLAVDTVQ